MALECVFADVKVDVSGNPILDLNGEKQFENYIFKFKNTYKNNKQIELRAGTAIDKVYLFTNYSDDPYSPMEFFYVVVDFVP